jgi:hypothetical protein
MAVALKILRAETRPFETDAERRAPGTIERDDDHHDHALRIATGDGWLVPLVLQRAGGKPLATADFLRGFDLPEQARFTLAEVAADRDAVAGDAVAEEGAEVGAYAHEPAERTKGAS